MGRQAYKLFTAQASTLDGAIAFDIPEDGVLESITWTAGGVSTAAAHGCLRYELSFGSSSTFATNDVRQVISSFAAGTNQSTASTGYASQGYAPMDVQLNAGERVFLHVLTNGTAPTSAFCTCVLNVNTKGASRPRYRS